MVPLDTFFFLLICSTARNPEISHTVPRRLLIPLSHALMAYRQRSAVENDALHSTIDIPPDRYTNKTKRPENELKT